jgi:signal transduction histidine kinase
VAQEALTNVRKHAPGAEVRLLRVYREVEIALEVRDFGARRKAGDLTASGAGYGLLGMRERAELLHDRALRYAHREGLAQPPGRNVT